MNAALPPSALKPRALYEDVAELLRQSIFNRELQPGQWIDELALAAQHSISRTPLREALKVLAAEGLVTMKVRRGAYVTEVSEQDLRDVFALLSLLESEAASIAATRASAADRAEWAALHAELNANQADTDRFFAINEAFHSSILRVANNRWLTQSVADLRKVMKLNRHHSLLKAGRIKESLAEHQSILQALLAADAEKARKRMAAHFQNGLVAAG